MSALIDTTKTAVIPIPTGCGRDNPLNVFRCLARGGARCVLIQVSKSLTLNSVAGQPKGASLSNA